MESLQPISRHPQIKIPLNNPTSARELSRLAFPLFAFIALAYWFKHAINYRFTFTTDGCAPPINNCAALMRYEWSSNSSISPWGDVSAQSIMQVYQNNILRTKIEKKLTAPLLGTNTETICVHELAPDKKSCATIKRNRLFPPSILSECLTLNTSSIPIERCKHTPNGERTLVTSLEELLNSTQSNLS